MHTMYDVEIRVSEYASKKPAGNVEVSVLYDYDSYGWFYFANTPAPVSGVTDNAGKVVLSLADYRYRILMRVGSFGTDLNKEMVRKGGTVAVPGNASTYMVELRPR